MERQVPVRSERRHPGRPELTDPLISDLMTACPDGVRATAPHRLAMAHDASHYLLIPRAVVVPTGHEQLAAAIRVARRHSTSVTFRSGGTSLSGQSVTDAVMIDTRRHFGGVEVLDDGELVRVGPGVTVRRLNAHLAPYRRRFGPDPASESACTVGGVIANNSSGMLCGTWANAYRTLVSAVLVLPSGTVIDTGLRDADDRLRAAEPELWQGLSRLRDRVRTDATSRRTVERLFSIKNTMGYGLNALLDHDRVSDILLHLVVGSEGTLAFVAEATFRTLPVAGHIATGLLVFDDLRSANEALPALVDSGLAAIELLDAGALAVAATDPTAPARITGLTLERHAALLVEHQRTSAAELADAVAATERVTGALDLVGDGGLSGDGATRSAYWHVRKGLYAAVAGARPSGTTALLEDIAVPVDRLAETCLTLETLFARYDYPGSVIFGHARDGNVHFLINERFGETGRLDAYAAFTEDMVEAVLGLGGTLKAEHGTGRIMAPFVARQYGDELYAVMRAIKRLCDPDGVLNPGAVISDDPQAHLRDLKTTETVEEEVDRCVECGFCEPVCPSRDLTLTPRQRIVLRRERERAVREGDTALVAELDEAYAYEGVQTCAADGMCATACPVLINTGDLVRRLRREEAPAGQQALWAATATRWDTTTRAAATALTAARAVPARLTTGVTDLARAVVDHDQLPRWSADLPAGGQRRADQHDPDPVAVFLPSCTSTMFGPATLEGPHLAGESTGIGSGPAFTELCRRAGVALRTPDGVADLCCGTPWKSKGLSRGLELMSARVIEALWSATDHGRLPVVVDASSCSEGLVEMIDHAPADRRMTVVDAVPFVAEHVLPRLTVTAPVGTVVLHPTCSSTRLGANDALYAIADTIAGATIVPVDWGCCAFAGDRGMLHPELTAAATAPEAAEVAGLRATAYASCNRTCEIGMTRATGHQYRNILELAEQATRPRRRR